MLNKNFHPKRYSKDIDKELISKIIRSYQIVYLKACQNKINYKRLYLIYSRLHVKEGSGYIKELLLTRFYNKPNSWIYKNLSISVITFKLIS